MSLPKSTGVTMAFFKKFFPCLAICVGLGLLACEDNPAADKVDEKNGPSEHVRAEPLKAVAVEPAPAAPQAPAITPPGEICTRLLNAAKARDIAKLHELSVDPSLPGLQASETRERLLNFLAGGSCGAARVGHDTASIAVTHGTVSRDLPLVLKNTKDVWKLDAAAYFAKYPEARTKEKHKIKDDRKNGHGKRKRH